LRDRQLIVDSFNAPSDLQLHPSKEAQVPLGVELEAVLRHVVEVRRRLERGVRRTPGLSDVVADHEGVVWPHLAQLVEDRRFPICETRNTHGVLEDELSPGCLFVWPQAV